MGLSFSKKIGGARFTVSKSGIYSSIGAGGVRYGTKINSTGKQIPNEIEFDEAEFFKNLSFKNKGYWVSLAVVCAVISSLAYIYLWSWLSNFIILGCGGAILVSIIGTLVYSKK
jgi:hypothetical protein